MLSMGFISFSKFLTTSDMDMVFFGLVVSWVKVMHFGVSTCVFEVVVVGGGNL